MQRIEKTVFLSYRRTNVPWALAIAQSLTQNGFDVFFDFNGIASGDFEKVIIGNIKARAHFVVLLTPSALDRCGEATDWLRREIEIAIQTKRNIVPITLEGFDFATPKIGTQLTGSIEPLKKYNALSVPADYFQEAMARLRDRYLNLPLEAVLHPASSDALHAARKVQAAATAAPAVTEKELAEQNLFERGYSAKEIEERIWYLTESVRLRPAPKKESGVESHAESLDRNHAAGSKVKSQEDLEPSISAKTGFLRQALEDIEHSYDVTLEALSDALDLRDHDNPGHSKRVTAYSIAISRALGIVPAQIKVIARGAFLHDIGKMALPAHVLARKAKITAKEREEIQECCIRGYEELRSIPFLAESAEIVRSY